MDKHIKQITVALAIAFLLGGVEMRAAVARLEATVTAMGQRVERIERELDTRHTYARAE